MDERDSRALKRTRSLKDLVKLEAEVAGEFE